MDRAGFEPADSALRRQLLLDISDEERVDWCSFEEYVSANCCREVTKDRLRYAKKYCHHLFKGNFSELNTFSDSKRNHILKALSGLAKRARMDAYSLQKPYE